MQSGQHSDVIYGQVIPSVAGSDQILELDKTRVSFPPEFEIPPVKIVISGSKKNLIIGDDSAPAKVEFGRNAIITPAALKNLITTWYPGKAALIKELMNDSLYAPSLPSNWNLFGGRAPDQIQIGGVEVGGLTIGGISIRPQPIASQTSGSAESVRAEASKAPESLVAPIARSHENVPQPSIRIEGFGSVRSEELKPSKKSLFSKKLQSASQLPSSAAVAARSQNILSDYASVERKEGVDRHGRKTIKVAVGCRNFGGFNVHSLEEFDQLMKNQDSQAQASLTPKSPGR